MPGSKRIQFTIEIATPAARVAGVMTGPATYRQWTTPFTEGCYFEGSWEAGQKILFLAPSGDGMVSEIAEHRPNDFISIRHLGFIAGGVEDTESDAVRAWAPAYENYTFVPTLDGTRVVVDMDVTEDFEGAMVEAWPKALATLKALCEAQGDA